VDGLAPIPALIAVGGAAAAAALAVLLALEPPVRRRLASLRAEAVAGLRGRALAATPANGERR
jgi:hypothetical protein